MLIRKKNNYYRLMVNNRYNFFFGQGFKRLITILVL